MRRKSKGSTRTRKLQAGEPVWELARLFSNQRRWPAEDYLALDTGRLVEYSDGFLEFPPVPTMAHQDFLQFLFELATLTALRLEGNKYTEHGCFGAGQVATSHLLPGFAVPVDEVWAAAQ